MIMKRISSRLPRLASTRGFTLTELLVVIAIISILSGMIGTGIMQARRNAKRAKAEAELRGLTTAWSQWFQLYGESTEYTWPTGIDGQSDLEMSAQNLGPIIDAENSHNPKGIVFLNASIEKTGKNPNRMYMDPWNHPYEMTFESTHYEDSKTFVITASITLPNCDMVQ